MVDYTEGSGKEYHIGVGKGDVGRYVILPGDPKRCEKIAKYFDNSIREDGILSISKGGIIYTPGSAGTLQEIFQEAVQNHYLTFGYASPMIFMGKQFWTEDVPVWPLIMDLVDKGRYKNLILCLTDEVDDVERVLQGK